MEGYERPEKIRKFHMVNNIDKFQYDRPYHKGNKDRDNEFKVRAHWSQIAIKVAHEFSYNFTRCFFKIFFEKALKSKVWIFYEVVNSLRMDL